MQNHLIKIIKIIIILFNKQVKTKNFSVVLSQISSKEKKPIKPVK